MTGEQKTNEYDVVVQVIPTKEIDELRLVLTEAGIHVTPLAGRSLDGQTVAEILLALGGSGLIAAAGKVLVTWIKARAGRRVKIGKIDITNYSADDVNQILDRLKSEKLE